jgi:uncharacterized protein (TIGR00730 family)
VQSICVFCGSSPGRDPVYLAAATAFGRALAERRLRVVYGGGNVGLMGAVADGALAAGGEVVGVIPRALVEREVAHVRLTELIVVETMHQRKATMAERADAFVALPGGAGTLEELFEVWTWGMLGFHQKPCALFDVAGYYQPLLAFVERAEADGFLRADHRAMLSIETDVDRLIERLRAFQPPRTKYDR